MAPTIVCKLAHTSVGIPAMTDEMAASSKEECGGNEREFWRISIVNTGQVGWPLAGTYSKLVMFISIFMFNLDGDMRVSGMCV